MRQLLNNERRWSTAELLNKTHQFNHDGSIGVFAVQMCLSSPPNESPGRVDAVGHIDVPSVNTIFCSRRKSEILMWSSDTASVTKSTKAAPQNSSWDTWIANSFVHLYFDQAYFLFSKPQRKTANTAAIPTTAIELMMMISNTGWFYYFNILQLLLSWYTYHRFLLEILMHNFSSYLFTYVCIFHNTAHVLQAHVV